MKTPEEEKKCEHIWFCAKEAWHYRDFYCSKCLANISWSKGKWSEIIEKKS